MIAAECYTTGAEVRGLEDAFSLAHWRPRLTADFSNPAASESGPLSLVGHMDSLQAITCSKCGEALPHGRASRVCTVCTRKHDMQYRAANRDKILRRKRVSYAANAERERKRSADYRAANHEQVLAALARWHERHREEGRRYAAEHRAADPQRAREAYRRYRARHPDRVRDSFASWKARNETYFSDWRRNNPDKTRLHKATRRAREAGTGGAYAAGDVRRAWLMQKGRCWWRVSRGCQQRKGRLGRSLEAATFHVEHVIALARGGDNTPGNIVLSCPECNLQKATKTPTEFAGRLL